MWTCNPGVYGYARGFGHAAYAYGPFSPILLPAVRLMGMHVPMHVPYVGATLASGGAGGFVYSQTALALEGFVSACGNVL